MNKINIALLTIIIIISLATANAGLKKSERAECLKWQGWQEQHNLFNPSEAMRDQCACHKITL